MGDEYGEIVKVLWHAQLGNKPNYSLHQKVKTENACFDKKLVQGIKD